MNAVTLPGLQVIILAAGFSSRLGRPKALAGVRAISLLRRTLTLAAGLAPGRIIVVVPRHSARLRIEALGFNVIFAVNPRRADGLSSSVRCGIARARFSSAVLLLPVDLALLKSRDASRLISHWRAARRCVIARRIAQGTGNAVAPHAAAPPGQYPDAAAAHTRTPRGGIPLILPRWLYPRALAVTGDAGLRDLINGLPSPQRMLLDLASAELDVDTREDLRAARRATARHFTAPRAMASATARGGDYSRAL
jgi:molybdenum cofactor cytidylyltransferase